MNLTSYASAVLIMATLLAREVSGADLPAFCVILRNEAAVPGA